VLIFPEKYASQIVYVSIFYDVKFVVLFHRV
jgi:hypothetical protein